MRVTLSMATVAGNRLHLKWKSHHRLHNVHYSIVKGSLNSLSPFPPPPPPRLNPTRYQQLTLPTAANYVVTTHRPYLPLLPAAASNVCSGPLFGRLNLDELNLPIIRDAEGWGLETAISEDWLRLENTLRLLLNNMLLIARFPEDFATWASPHRHLYNRKFRTRKWAAEQILEAKNAFLALMSTIALFYFLLEARDHDLHSHSPDPSTPWQLEVQKSCGLPFATIDAFKQSPIADRNLERLGGVFLYLSIKRWDRLFRVLLTLEMPIAILWDIPFQADTHLIKEVEPFGPSADDLYELDKQEQEHMEKRQSSLLSSQEKSSAKCAVEPGSGQHPGESLSEFLARRQHRTSILKSNEPEKLKLRRIDRERFAWRNQDPDILGSRVYLWTQTDDGDRRSRVRTAEMRRVWSRFPKSKKHYNGFYNEWDIYTTSRTRKRVKGPSSITTNQPPEYQHDAEHLDDDDDDDDEPDIPPSSPTSNHSPSDISEAWEILREFATMTMTLPQAEALLQQHFKSSAISQEWQARLGFITEFEGSQSALLAALDEFIHPQDVSNVPASDYVLQLAEEENLDDDHALADAIIDLKIVQEQNFSTSPTRSDIIWEHEDLTERAKFRFGFLSGCTPPIAQFEMNKLIIRKVLGNGNDKSERTEKFQAPSTNELELIRFFTIMVNPNRLQKGIIDFQQENILALFPNSRIVPTEIELRNPDNQPTKDEYWYQLAHPKPNECLYFVVVSRASVALEAIRRNWSSDPSALIPTLISFGAQFRTLLLGPHSPTRTQNQPQQCLGLGYRPNGWAAERYDYTHYENRRNELLRSPCGRAAVLAGGIISRIARDIVDVDLVIYGPSDGVLTSGICLQSSRARNDNTPSYWDDYLTDDDTHLICGSYKFDLGHRSWWPLPEEWERSGLFTGVWTEDCEQWYQSRLSKIRDGSAKPMGKREWKNVLKFDKEVPRIVGQYEHLASTYIRTRTCDDRGLNATLPKDSHLPTGPTSWLLY